MKHKKTKVINLIDKPLNSAEVMIPEGYGIVVDSKGDKKLRKRIGTKTLRKTNLDNEYQVKVVKEEIFQEKNGKLEKISERDRVSRTLINEEKAKFYEVAHDHAKKVKGDSKGSIKAKFQRQTENATAIIAKAGSDKLSIDIQAAYKLYTAKQMPLRNFESKIRNSWKFRLEVLKETKIDFEKYFGTPENLRPRKKSKK